VIRRAISPRVCPPRAGRHVRAPTCRSATSLSRPSDGKSTPASATYMAIASGGRGAVASPCASTEPHRNVATLRGRWRCVAQTSVCETAPGAAPNRPKRLSSTRLTIKGSSTRPPTGSATSLHMNQTLGYARVVDGRPESRPPGGRAHRRRLPPDLRGAGHRCPGRATATGPGSRPPGGPRPHGGAVAHFATTRPGSTSHRC
jgi:hypothetical protein